MRKSLTILLALMFVFAGCLDDKDVFVEDILEEQGSLTSHEGFDDLTRVNIKKKLRL